MEKDSEFILKGPKREVIFSHMSLSDYIHTHMKKNLDKGLLQVLIDVGEEITFKEMYKMSAQICRGLVQKGMQRGDVVSLIGRNSNQLHASFLGILWAGGVPHPLDGDVKLREIELVLRQTKPKWVFCEPGDFPVVSQALTTANLKSNIIIINSAAEYGEQTRLESIMTDFDLSAFSPVPVQDVEEDWALIASSSGTTGAPKAVALTHQNIIRNISIWQTCEKMDIITHPALVTSTFSWISGIYLLITACVHGSFRAVTTSTDPRVLMKAIQDYKLQESMLPPAVIKLILEDPSFKKAEYDLSSLNRIYTGGSILAQSTIDQFKREWPEKSLLQMYGMTELAGATTMPIGKNMDPRSCGVVLFNNEIKIVDLDTGRALGPNQQGEVCIRSPCLFKTYVGMPDEARKTIDEEGWLHSGDIGYYAEDKQIYLVNRKKEIFKYENHTVSPVELENFILGLDGVVDVGIVGISVRDDSHLVMAIVVKQENSDITGDYIIQKVADNFSDYKHIRAGLHFVARLPRSTAGKLQRNKLTELANKLYKENN